MNKFEELELCFKKILLRDIEIHLRGKCVVRDTLIFYEFKDFNFKFIFKSNKKFEFPYPFEMDISNSDIKLLYHNKYIHHDDPIHRFKMINCIKKMKNKFYNSTINIIINNA